MTYDQNTLIRTHPSYDPVACYRENEVDFREFSKGNNVFRRTVHEYTLENIPAAMVDELDRNRIKELFAGREHHSPMEEPITELSLESLCGLVRGDLSPVRRSQALAELQARGADDLGLLVIQCLKEPHSSRSWRNTLLLVSEHIRLLDRELRLELRSLLLACCLSMEGEWHTRSQHAISAAVRTICALTDNTEKLADLIPFLVLQFPPEVARIVLISIEQSPLSANVSGNRCLALKDLRLVIRGIAGANLTSSIYSLSDEAFDLGLDALRALVAIKDEECCKYIRQAQDLDLGWVSRELNQGMGQLLHQSV